MSHLNTECRVVVPILALLSNPNGRGKRKGREVNGFGTDARIRNGCAARQLVLHELGLRVVRFRNEEVVRARSGPRWWGRSGS